MTVYKYKNTYHSIIKMETVDELFRTYIDINRENNQKDRKSEDGDHKYRNKKHFCKRLLSKLIRKNVCL